MLDTLIGTISGFAKDELKRNERVIILLKKFNLDPDHPPKEFSGVYNYALVEYGVGKPLAILQLFREEEIQKAFRKAFDADNPDIVIQEIEQILIPDEWNILEEGIREEQINVLHELAEFSAVFLKVVELTRTPAEVQRDRNIASLQQELTIIKQQLQQLGTLKEISTHLAKITNLEKPHPNPLLINERGKAKQKECKAENLALQLQGWFKTLGYQFEKYQVWETDYFELIIKIQGRRRFDRILIRGIDGEATISDLINLRQSVETQKTDEGWLIAARRISRAARDEVKKDENEDLFCYTLDELIDETADFTNYINWLEDEIKKRKVDEMYVPLACSKEEFDPVTKQKMGVSRYDEQDGWIDGYVDTWIDDPAKEHLSILGEFGTGKTWFAFHYAYQALLKYKQAKRKGLSRPRLPLVILLRDYAKALDVENVMAGFFYSQHEISLNSSVFEQLNRMGKLLLIFDGFDEMAARVDRQAMINNFWELAKVVVPCAKVILTCRTEHFPEAKQGRSLLNAELRASVANLTAESPQFEVLELEKFSDEQIRQVFSHVANTDTVDKVMHNPQLLDLARRPVMSDLILEALPDIEAGKPVDMSRVYLYAVRRKMERDIKSERTFTSLADKMYFLCEIAWEMLSTDQMSLNYRLFPDRIRRLFGSAVEEQKDLDHWHYDMMGQTMLVRNADGDYTP
ncbi:MAG: NACHT domain-containing protein, partial [Cyanobacteria bacterium J06573_2]